MTLVLSRHRAQLLMLTNMKPLLLWHENDDGWCESLILGSLLLVCSDRLSPPLFGMSQSRKWQAAPLLWLAGVSCLIVCIR